VDDCRVKSLNVSKTYEAATEAFPERGESITTPKRGNRSNRKGQRGTSDIESTAKKICPIGKFLKLPGVGRGRAKAWGDAR